MAQCLIGFTACRREVEEGHEQYVPESYRRALQGEGLTPVLLRYDMTRSELNALLPTLSGVLFSGGPDVHPARYGRAVEAECGEICPERDELELTLLDMVIERDLPVLGICRGIQLLNVGLGGTLVQHIPAVFGECHRQPESDQYAHEVEIERGTRLFGLSDSPRVMVNSFHHQCIERVAPALRVNARHGSMIEGVEWPEKRFFMGVQWHPERSYADDSLSKRIFEAFAASCREE